MSDGRPAMRRLWGIVVSPDCGEVVAEAGEVNGGSRGRIEEPQPPRARVPMSGGEVDLGTVKNAGKVLSAFALAVTCGCLAGAATAAPVDPRPPALPATCKAAAAPAVFAVLPWQDSKRHGKDTAANAAAVMALLEVELAALPGIVVVERENVSKLLKEFTAAGQAVSPTGSALKIGSLLHADYVIFTGVETDSVTGVLAVTVLKATTAEHMGQFRFVLSKDTPGDLAREIARDAVACVASDSPARITVAVGPIANNSRLAAMDYVGSGLRWTLVDALSRQAGVRVVARRSLDALLKERDLLAAGVTTTGTAASVKSPPTARYWLDGSYTAQFEGSNASLAVQMTVTDVGSGRQVASFVSRGMLADIGPLRTALLGQALASIGNEQAARAGEQALEARHLHHRLDVAYAELEKRYPSATAHLTIEHIIPALESILFLDPTNDHVMLSLACQYVGSNFYEGVPPNRSGWFFDWMEDDEWISYVTASDGDISKAKTLAETLIRGGLASPLIRVHAAQLLTQIQVYEYEKLKRKTPPLGDPETIRGDLETCLNLLLEDHRFSDEEINAGLRRLYPPPYPWTQSYGMRMCSEYLLRVRSQSMAKGIEVLCDIGRQPETSKYVLRFADYIARHPSWQTPGPAGIHECTHLLARECLTGRLSWGQVSPALTAWAEDRRWWVAQHALPAVIEHYTAIKDWSGAIKYQKLLVRYHQELYRSPSEAREALQGVATLEEKRGATPEAVASARGMASTIRTTIEWLDEYSARVIPLLKGGDVAAAEALFWELRKKDDHAASALFSAMQKAGYVDAACVQFQMRQVEAPKKMPALDSLEAPLPTVLAARLKGRAVAKFRCEPILWVVTKRDGIFCFDESAGSVQHFELPTDVALHARWIADGGTGWKYARATAWGLYFPLKESVDGNAAAGGLACLRNDGRVSIASGPNAPQGFPIMMELAGRYLWVSAPSGVLHVHDCVSETWEQLPDRTRQYEWILGFYGSRLLAQGRLGQSLADWTFSAFDCIKEEGKPARLAPTKRPKFAKVLCVVADMEWRLGERRKDWYTSTGLYAKDRRDGAVYSVGPCNGLPNQELTFLATFTDGAIMIPPIGGKTSAWLSIPTQDLVRVAEKLRERAPKK